MSKTYPVSEIFGPTIQGEGYLVGSQTSFIRMAGCEFRCAWCDTMYAVDPKNPGWLKRDMTAIQIMSELPNCEMVTISGGNPALYVDHALLDTLEQHGNRVVIESQGTQLGAWVTHRALVELTVSPKPPSSGMEGRYMSEVIGSLCEAINSRSAKRRHTTLKYVFENLLDDLDWIAQFDRNLPICGSFVDRYLSVCTPAEIANNPVALRPYLASRIECLIKDPRFAQFRILPQLHVLLWGPKKGV